MAQVGEKAPHFALQNSEGKVIDLNDYIGKGPVVVLFFPLAFTGVCTTEMCTIRDNMKAMNESDATVFGVSVDSFFTLAQFKSMNNLNFDLLSDFNKQAIRAYDVYNGDFFGMDGIANRSAFVIDKDGVIQYAEVLDDAGHEPNYSTILEKIQELA
jgi:peroxiredoxin